MFEENSLNPFSYSSYITDFSPNYPRSKSLHSYVQHTRIHPCNPVQDPYTRDLRLSLPGLRSITTGNLILNASIASSYVFSAQLFMFFIFIDHVERDLKNGGGEAEIYTIKHIFYRNQNSMYFFRLRCENSFQFFKVSLTAYVNL